MSIKRIFIVISAIFAASAVFADNSSVTSKKYVDDLMSGYQGKLPGSGANTLMIYDDETGIGEKSIETTLGSGVTGVPTVGAVKTGLDGKQDTITGTAGYVMTGTGTPGDVGEKPIYGTTTNYSDSLVTAEAVNTGVINAVNSSLIRVDENGYPSNTGTLWEINTDLIAINANVPYGYTELQYVVFSGGQYIDTGIVLTSPNNIENIINVKMDADHLSNFQTLTGCMYPSGTPRYGINAYLGQWMIGVDATIVDGVVLDSNQHRLKFVTTSNQQTLYDTDDSVLANYSMSAYSFSSNELSLYVGARKQPNSISNYVYGNIGKTYLKQNGVMLYDYIPARRNSDNAVGFYDMVSGNFLTHSGLTAGPSCISPNLFDGQIELGSIDTTNGSLVVNNSRTRSVNYIPVEPNTTYTFTRENLNGVRWIVCYDANKNGITDGLMSYPAAIAYIQSGGTATTFTTTPTTRYIKWYDTSNAGLNEKVQIEQGSNATTYRPYGENICD